MSARDCFTVRRQSETDRCDWCGVDINIGAKKYTADDFDTVACCADHADIVAGGRHSGLRPLGVW